MFNKHRQLYMEHRHLYTPPLVLQTPDVQLERDLLQGASSLGMIRATGHEEEETDAFVNSAWD